MPKKGKRNALNAVSKPTLYMGLYAERLYRMKWPEVYPFIKVSSFIVYKGFIILLLALHYIFFMVKEYTNARIMKFIPNQIRNMFSKVSSIIRVLDNDLENLNV